jgi:hypothetical protein
MNKKEINILKKCSKNVLQFSHYAKIVTDHGLDTYEPYSFQKKLLKKFSDGLKPENMRRRNQIVLAPRQCGKTTIIAIYALWYIIFNPDKSVAIMSHKLDAAKEILYKIREIYCNLPEFMRPFATTNCNEKLQFENHSYIIAVSCSSRAVRGRSIDLLIMDEAAFMRKSDFDNFLMSVFPTQAGRLDAQMILISTPHGIDHGFYEIWKRAINGENSFIPSKIRWNCVPHRNEEWKERIIRECGDIFFRQEYAVEFIGSK